MHRIYLSFFFSGILLSLPFYGHPLSGGEKFLGCATTPDLKSILQYIGGEYWESISFVQGPEDPHYIEVRPGMIRSLNRCKIYLQVGLELEEGWAGGLLYNAQNPYILPSAKGWFSGDLWILPLEVPSTPVDRSMGDIHPRGNPHYLLDPINGGIIGRKIYEKLCELDPPHCKTYEENFQKFSRTLLEVLFGEMGKKLSSPGEFFSEIASLSQEEFWRRYEDQVSPGSLLFLTKGVRKKKFIGDHRIYSYLCKRLDCEIVGDLEPKPGIPPSTRHLEELRTLLTSVKIAGFLSAPYYPEKYFRFLQEGTSIPILPIAHQTGSREGTEEYIKMVEYNFKLLSSVGGN